MSELSQDEKFTTIELTSDLGINFSGENTRIKHTGTGLFSILSNVGKIKIEATSNILDDAIKINAPNGGIDVDATDFDLAVTNDITMIAVEGITVTNTGDETALTLNQTGDASVLDVQHNGSSAIIVESDGTVGINTSNPNNTYALDVNGIMNATSVYQANALLVPTGGLMPYAGATAPTGWLMCRGAAVSRTTYSALFAVIGTTYGVGDGSTTFNLPNIAGRVIVGLDTGDTSFDELGETGGSKTKTLSTSEIPSHTHTGTTDADGAHTHTVNISDPGHTHTVSNTVQITGSNTVGNPDSSPDEIDNNNTTTTTSSSSTTGITASTVSAGSHTHTFTTGATGGGSSFSILNPYFTMNYIIKH